jgi:hypothetical protein
VLHGQSERTNAVRESTYGRLTNPDAWRVQLPGPLFDALAIWVRCKPFDLTHRGWLHGGSGSHVALVRVNPEHGMMREYILKLLPPAIADAESRGVGLAQQHSPEEFRLQHLVSTEDVSKLEYAGWCVHMQGVAQGDLSSLRPLGKFIGDPKLGDYCETILTSIVRDWNSIHDPKPRTSKAAQFLGEALEDMVVQGGGLAEFLQKANLHHVDSDRMVIFPNRSAELPNPLTLMSGSLSDELGILEIFLGNGHGDLHLNNVLVPCRPGVDPSRYQLIDLGRFSPKTPISRDPVKLLLSLAAEWLLSLAPGAGIRECLAEILVMPSSHPPAPAVAGYQAIAAGIHSAAKSWADRRQMGHAWTKQNLLVLIASALRYTGQLELAIEDRWWFFEVAALATRAIQHIDDPEFTDTPSRCLHGQQQLGATWVAASPDPPTPAGGTNRLAPNRAAIPVRTGDRQDKSPIMGLRVPGEEVRKASCESASPPQAPDSTLIRNGDAPLLISGRQKAVKLLLNRRIWLAAAVVASGIACAVAAYLHGGSNPSSPSRSRLYWQGTVDLSARGDFAVALDHRPPHLNTGTGPNDLVLNGTSKNVLVMPGPNYIAIWDHNSVPNPQRCRTQLTTAGSVPRLQQSEIRAGISICMRTQAGRLAVVHINQISFPNAPAAARGLSTKVFVYDLSSVGGP